MRRRFTAQRLVAFPRSRRSALAEPMEARLLFAANYTIVDLGTVDGGPYSSANDINNAGTVVGSSSVAADPNGGVAFYWDGTMHSLGYLPNGSSSSAFAINSAGVIVGSSNKSPSSNGVAVLYANGGVTELPSLGGPPSGSGTAINASGQIAGSSYAPPEGPSTFGRASLITNGAIQNLGALGGQASFATDVNDNGVVVGQAYTTNNLNTFAFRWDGTMRSLGSLGGRISTANAINNNGLIVGDSNKATGSDTVAFYYDTEMHAIGDGTLINGSAKDVNATGQIVGRSNVGVFLFENGAVSMLGDLLPAGHGWTLFEANAINDRGQIVGKGVNPDGKQHAYLLNPEGLVPDGPPAGGTVNLTTDVTTSTLPAVFVPGDKGKATVRLNNVGTDTAAGTVSVSLYASLDNTFDSGDVPLDTGTTLSNKRLNLKGTKSATFTGSFVAPATIAPGTYFIVAKLDPGAIGQSSTADDNGASATTFEARRGFGTLGNRAKVKLATTDGDGSLVTYQLTGPGTATYTVGSDGNADIAFTGTTLASKFTVTAKSGDGAAAIHDISADAPLGTIALPKADLTGSLTITGDAKAITLRNVADQHGLTVGGATPVALTLGAVVNATLTSTAGIKSLTVASWTDNDATADVITAPYVGTITSKGAFEAGLTLSGAGAANGVALKSAKIAASVGAKTWQIGGATGALTIGGAVPTGFSANVAGLLASLTVTGDLAGNIAAANIGSVTVKGTATGARLLAGTSFGADGALFGNDDTYGTGAFKSLKVTGAVTGSLFAAGLTLVGGDLATGDDVLAVDAVLKSAAFKSTLSDDSNVLAGVLPKKVSVNGASVDPATDARFQLA